MVFLATRTIATRKHVHIVGNSSIQWMYATRNMVILQDTLFDGKTKTVENRDENTDQEIKFTPQQYQALMALIKQPNEATASTQVNQVSTISSSFTDQGNKFLDIWPTKFQNNDVWILDSGATNHVSINLKSFSSYEPVDSIIVNLPNALKTKATYKGIINSVILLLL